MTIFLSNSDKTFSLFVWESKYNGIFDEVSILDISYIYVIPIFSTWFQPLLAKELTKRRSSQPYINTIYHDMMEHIDRKFAAEIPSSRVLLLLKSYKLLSCKS